MTEVTYEHLEIMSLADVEAIDPATNNRYAVRSLRHAARRALSTAVSLGVARDELINAVNLPGYHTMRRAALETTSLGCSGEETRERWSELLDGTDGRLEEAASAVTAELEALPAKIDAAVVAVKERVAAIPAEITEQITFAKAALAKAKAILDAHPEGLPESEEPPVGLEDVDTDDLDDIDEVEDGDEL